MTNLPTNLHNNTKKYILIVDGVFGYLDTLADVKVAQKIAMGDADIIDETCFWSMSVLAPNQTLGRSDKESTPITNYQAIDIVGYATKRPQRAALKFSIEHQHRDPLAGKCDLPRRFAEYKNRNVSLMDLDLDDLDLSVWTAEKAQADWLKVVPNADLSKYKFEI